jgi:Ca-activated chloride channel family protein
MRTRVGCLVVLALLAAGAARAGRLEVGIVEPPAGQPLFGPVEVAVEVRGGDAVRVVLELDGRRVGELEAPPWRFALDAGEDNRARLLRAVAYAADGSSAAAELETPALRVDEVVELPLRQVYVTATREDAAVLDLERRDFRLLDDGRPQRLVTFERGDVPLTAELLIDSSLSMRGSSLAAALAGARAFVEAMAPLDEAAVLLVADGVVRRTPIGRDPEGLLAGLEGAAGRGGSAINDHLFLALSELATRQGRRVVVLLSDGVDLDSVLSAADLEPIVGGSPALLYWIRLGGDSSHLRRRSVWRDFDEHDAELEGLARLVGRSGGRIYDLPDVAGAPEVFRAVLEELRSQYVLGYYPDRPRADGSWRRIRVEVARDGVRLRAREGYYDD